MVSVASNGAARPKCPMASDSQGLTPLAVIFRPSEANGRVLEHSERGPPALELEESGGDEATESDAFSEQQQQLNVQATVDG